MLYNLVTQAPTQTATIGNTLQNIANTGLYDHADIAVAYATRSGLGIFDGVFSPGTLTSRWVLGLNDCVTEPRLLTTLTARPDANMRATLLTSNARFHPKIYLFSSLHDPSRATSIIGSGNFTRNGLDQNAEAAVQLTAESVAEADTLKAQFDAYWNAGFTMTAADLAAYTAAYNNNRAINKKAKAKRKKAVRPSLTKLSTSQRIAVNLAPSQQAIGWLDAGTPSAGGRDLEFPAAMAPYFGLGHLPATKTFRLANGASHNITFKMRSDNQMLRLLLNTAAIQDGIGRPDLRPLAGGTRSDLAVVFKEAPAGAAWDYDLWFELIGGAAYQQLVAHAQAAGNLQYTMAPTNPSGRQFGSY